MNCSTASAPVIVGVQATAAECSTMRDLFGSTEFKMVIDLPSHLDHLVASLPPGHDYSADRLINEHTLLPFYAPFLSPERVARVRMEMRRPSGHARARGRAGASRLAMRLECLHYCLMCIEEDRERCGEAYWHRVHQASGVKICSSHDVVLEPSGINAINRADREELVTLEESLLTAPLRTPDRRDLSDRSHEFHLAIARDVRWLLDQRGLCEEPAVPRRGRVSTPQANTIESYGLRNARLRTVRRG